MTEVVGYVETLVDRIRQRTARVAVIGLGHAGLPLLQALAAEGFPTVGVDRDAERVKGLTRGISPVVDVTDESLQYLIQTAQLTFTTSLDEAATCDVSIICVPTPLKGLQPDLSAVTVVSQRLGEIIPDNHLVVLESTTYPGTTQEVVLPLLERHGRKVGHNLFVAFSPERVDPGNQSFGIRNTPRLVGGVTPACCEAARALYGAVVADVIPVSSPAVCEAAKVLENTYRLVNIALVNEFSVFCHSMNLNVWEVIQAAATKPYGFTPFWPGPGIGGHCIPVDPGYLTWKAREQGTALRLVETAMETNKCMENFVIDRITDILNNAGLPLRNARVLILGIAYKPDVSDPRESPALPVLHSLMQKGAMVGYHDPLIPATNVGGQRYESAADLDQEVLRADLVVVMTNHSAYDWEEIERRSARIFDTRGSLLFLNSPKVISL